VWSPEPAKGKVTLCSWDKVRLGKVEAAAADVRPQKRNQKAMLTVADPIQTFHITTATQTTLFSSNPTLSTPPLPWLLQDIST